MIHDGCTGCNWEDESMDSKKCKGCRGTFLSKYTPKGKNHIGCEGCDYEHQKNAICKSCLHNAKDKYEPRK